MIESKVSLKQFNTFGIDVSSKFFAQRKLYLSKGPLVWQRERLVLRRKHFE